MAADNAVLAVERTVDSIVVGARHRTDLGDLAPLIASIERIGLLQPVTITPDGVLICGHRRLEAVKRLGWRTLRVWVRTGLSDHLTRLLAEQDENTLHKPLSPIEAAALYRELKQVLAEDAVARQEATRFGAAEDSAGVNGAADSAGPPRGYGDARRQAATLVTQSASYNRLEQVGWLERTAADAAQPARIRDLAARELERVRHGGAVDPSYQRVKAAAELLAAATHQGSSPTPPQSLKQSLGPAGGSDGAAVASTAQELEVLAAEALRRSKPDRTRRAATTTAAASRALPDSGRRPLRYFLLTWRDLDGWTAFYDPAEIAAAVGEEDWAMFERVLAETNAFADAARHARQ